jgi:large subunit ribosomal protein L24
MSRPQSKGHLKQSTKLHVKRGDTVLVLSGKDKGKTGTVTRVFPERGKILVDGVNIIKKHTKPNPAAGIQGGIVQIEAPLPSAKVMLYSPAAQKPTRIMKNVIEGEKGTKKRVRVCRHTNIQLD